ncbi:hypothetical protein M407DRAFT_32981 [Tulasnella calospora MUT 4182]|uniref:Protein kinase domain-containing protein n=1 Tax=Tulasnella calospora MUT 4182 TaxID=1051891 RepID=A0A0C3Q341_9AGAM|nr:hypothetical protein M407DRAFT_32981 [Tulasnella calospora MUT 4182]
MEISPDTSSEVPEIPHGHGLHSSVYRTPIRTDETEIGSPKWTVIKRVGDHPPWKFQPHNVRKEIRILRAARNENIVSILRSSVVEDFEITWELEMPLIPLSLSTLLDSVAFIPEEKSKLLPPQLKIAGPAASPSQLTFEVLTKSIIYQVLLALDYLHTGINGKEQGQVAHRDVKPSNILIDEVGCVKLIDFGIAWAPDFVHPSGQTDLQGMEVEEEYVEPPEKMCCAVTSGPYRPPELLFSPPTYNAFAVDMWSTGALVAEFFTSLRFVREPSYMDDDFGEGGDEEEEVMSEPATEPFVPPKYFSKVSDGTGGPSVVGKWSRVSLFDSSRGEIGLAWSIFRVRGTPNQMNWPSFKTLPDAESASFRETPRIDLTTRLPHLPANRVFTANASDMIELLLEYEPGDRISAAHALRRPWFKSVDGVPLLLPAGHPAISLPESSGARFGGKSLEDYLKPWMKWELDKLVEEDGRAVARNAASRGELNWDDLSD